MFDKNSIALLTACFWKVLKKVVQNQHVWEINFMLVNGGCTYVSKNSFKL